MRMLACAETLRVPPLGAHLHHSGVERIQRDDLAQQRRLLVRALRVLPDLGKVDHVRDDEQNGCAQREKRQSLSDTTVEDKLANLKTLFASVSLPPPCGFWPILAKQTMCAIMNRMAARSSERAGVSGHGDASAARLEACVCMWGGTSLPLSSLHDATLRWCQQPWGAQVWGFA